MNSFVYTMFCSPCLKQYLFTAIELQVSIRLKNIMCITLNDVIQVMTSCVVLPLLSLNVKCCECICTHVCSIGCFKPGAYVH